MSNKIIANNKKAYHEYFIEEKYEAGLVLVGTEVKSIRQGKVNFKDSYVGIKNGEAFVYNLHISPASLTTHIYKQFLKSFQLLRLRGNFFVFLWK